MYACEKSSDTVAEFEKSFKTEKKDTALGIYWQNNLEWIWQQIGCVWDKSFRGIWTVRPSPPFPMNSPHSAVMTFEISSLKRPTPSLWIDGNRSWVHSKLSELRIEDYCNDSAKRATEVFSRTVSFIGFALCRKRHRISCRRTSPRC